MQQEERGGRLKSASWPSPCLNIMSTPAPITEIGLKLPVDLQVEERPMNTPALVPATRSNLCARHPPALQRLPRRFQQQTLLRIHASRLARRDAEHLGIERVHAIEETAFDQFADSARVHFQLGGGFGQRDPHARNVFSKADTL